MLHPEINEALTELDDVIAASGVHGALKFLNSRAPHRFTGIYRIDPPVLHNVRLFDRENPALEVGGDAPLQETYCSITGEKSSAFATADAQADPRLEDHPARDTTLSYCGVPLLSEMGEAIGTLCHFDLVAREIPPGETELMLSAASRLLPLLREQGEFPR